MASAKPVIHGPDHRPGGPDPIHGLGGLQYHEGTYGPYNVGDWLDVTTTGDSGTSSFGDIGISILATGGGHGAVFGSTDGAGNTYLTADGGNIYLSGPGGGAFSNSIYLVGDSATAYLNVNGFATGMDFLGAGPTSFGVTTFEVDSTGGLFLNDNSSVGIDVEAAGSGTIEIRQAGSGGFNLISNSGGMLLNVVKPLIFNATGGTTETTIQARISSGNQFAVMDTGAHQIFIVSSNGSSPGSIRMPDLPTSSGTTGELYKSGGFVKIV